MSSQSDESFILSSIEAWVRETSLSCDGVMRRTVQLLHERFPHYHWVGIYLLNGDALELGPYVGKHTEHTRISIGEGVCGTAVFENRNIRVDDVQELENYLACSLETRSEIVVLIRDPQGRITGQIDIDSDEPAAFSVQDQQFLESVAERLGELFVSARC